MPVENSTILIVDDEDRILFVLQNALRKLEEGIEVIGAHTAHDALRKVEDEGCDLVITDLIMPDMDGVEFTERIQDIENGPTVVWMTAYGCRSFAAEAERLGVYRCVEKPLEIGEVRQLAREALLARRSGGDSGEGPS